jgi:RHS repeat-associated protein
VTCPLFPHSFKYDPLGRRIEKVSPTTTSVFAYDGDNLIDETNSSGTVVTRYEQTQNIDEPVAMLRSSATSYYNADGLGSVTSLTNSSGAAAQTYTYDSYGNVTASSGSLTNPFQYTGREFDSETGMYYYRARYFDPSTGRFLSEDGLRFQGGDNFYRYAKNSPLVRIDPTGNKTCWSVTAKTFSETPCANPNGDMSCIYVPGGVSCVVPTPQNPPSSPPDHPGFAPGCKCNLLNYYIESEHIILKGEGKILGTGDQALTATIGFQIGEQILKYVGAGGIAEWVPAVDVGFLFYHGYEDSEAYSESVEELRRLNEEWNENCAQ